jgi:linoleoyl-CoA desaturase
MISDPWPIPWIWRDAVKTPIIIIVEWTLLLWLVLMPHGIVAAGLLCIASGFAMAVGVISVGHDVMHRQFKRHKVAAEIAISLVAFGATRRWWITKHNVVHHTGTPGSKHYEAPLQLGAFARLAEDQTWRPWHRYQWLYFWPILATQHLSIVIQNTVVSISGRFMGQQIAPRGVVHAAQRLLVQWTIPTALIVAATRHHGVLGILGGILVITLADGLATSAVLLVEVVERVAAHGRLVDGWAGFQFAASMSINRRSRVLTWLTGGLNLHHAHHLFPTLPAYRLPHIDAALMQVAAEEGLQPNEYATYRQSWLTFARFLRGLSTPPATSGATVQASAG